MALIFQSFLVTMGLLVIFTSIYKRKVPKGILEWLIIIGTIIIIYYWMISK